MPTHTFAPFVKHPRTIGDLLHPIAENRRFKIAEVVVLQAIDYDNFITDMLVDRPFLNSNLFGCIDGDTWYCVFVTQSGAKDGVLVLPEGDHVEYAAYLAYDGDIESLMSAYEDPDRLYTRKELEAMTTDQLNHILKESMYVRSISESYIDLILLTLDVLEKRGDCLPTPDLDATWESIMEMYLDSDDSSDNDS